MGGRNTSFFVYFGWETREQVVLQALHGMLSYICGGEGEKMTGASIGRVSSRRKLHPGWRGSEPWSHAYISWEERNRKIGHKENVNCRARGGGAANVPCRSGAG